MSFFKIGVMLMSAVALLTSACMKAIIKPHSVFGDDIAFRADPNDKDVFLYANPEHKARSYSKFLIDPVKIYSNSPGGLGPKETKELSEEFRNELVEAMQRDYKVVDSPGPEVLRIRAAIVDIQPSQVELDEDRFLVLRLDTALMRVSMELECLDSQSGERIAALYHYLDERKYLDKKQQKRLLNIQEAFRAWISSLKQRFDKAKATPENPLEGFDVEEEKKLHSEEGQ